MASQPRFDAPPPGVEVAAEPGGLEALLLERRLVAPAALARAQRVQVETGERLAAVLTRLGLVADNALAEALAQAAGLPLADRETYLTDPAEAPRVPPRFMRDARAAFLRPDGGPGWRVALLDSLDLYPVEALRLALGEPVRPCVGRASDIEAALERLYGARDLAAVSDEGASELDLERLKDLASDAPAIRAVNRLIAAAVDSRASDIHLEPDEDSLKVRFRVDGAMRELEPLGPALRATVPSRIKVMAGLNIAERRLPQDGRMRLAVRGHDIDLRVATSPTLHGEAVVLRLLDRSELSLDFIALGFEPPLLQALRPLLARPHGVLLVTGPTGSGKTTTLYAALSELNRPDRKLLTIEDPVEYRLAGVNQTQVAPAIGLDFASALRSFLRQDPDIIMVGEVRDLETAQVAVQAALTGHMILSTLHTNSAAAAVTRLLDMGVEPFLITSTLNAVLAQRLVRRLCPGCRTPYTADARRFGTDAALAGPRTFWRAVGCPACRGEGYVGRIAIAELLVLDEGLAELVLARAGAQLIEAEAARRGMAPMLADGLSKAERGLTTPEEVLRVTREA